MEKFFVVDSKGGEQHQWSEQQAASREAYCPAEARSRKMLLCLSNGRYMVTQIKVNNADQSWLVSQTYGSTTNRGCRKYVSGLTTEVPSGDDWKVPERPSCGK